MSVLVALGVDVFTRTMTALAGVRGKMEIDPDAPAILIWLPEGVSPSDQDFAGNQSWTLEQAVEQA